MDVSSAVRIKRSNYPVLSEVQPAGPTTTGARAPNIAAANRGSLDIPGKPGLPGRAGQQRVYGARTLPKITAEDITVSGREVVDFIQSLPSPAVLRAHGIAPFLAFDADGTLWKDDFPGRLLAAAAERGMLRPEARDRLNAHMQRMGLEPDARGPDKGVNRDTLRAFAETERYMATVPPAQFEAAYNDVCETAVGLLAGLTPKALQALTSEVVATATRTDVFAEVPKILDAARAKGLTPILITAGLEAVNGRFARELGFKGHEIRGLRSSVGPDGKYTGQRVGILTAGEGKRLATMELMSTLGSPQDGRRKPVAGFGDSPTHGDRALHSMSHVGFVVEPTGPHAAHAVGLAKKGQNIRILDIAHTRDGQPVNKYVPGRRE